MSSVDEGLPNLQTYVRSVLNGRNSGRGSVEWNGEYTELNSPRKITTEGEMEIQILDQELYDEKTVVQLGSFDEFWAELSPWADHVLTDGGEADLYLLTSEIAEPLHKQGEHGYTEAYVVVSDGEETETIGITQAAGDDWGKTYPAQNKDIGETGLENITEVAYIKPLHPDEEGNYQSVRIALSADAIARTLNEPALDASHIPKSIDIPEPRTEED